MTPPRSKICVLCSVRPATTQDHVPPKGVFKGSTTGLRLITVPACAECNNGATDWDDAFRTYLSIEAGRSNAASAALWDKGAKNSLAQRPDLRQHLGRSAKEVIDPSNGQMRLAFTLPGSLVDRVLGRTVRGLHYFHTTRILTPHTRVIVDKADGLIDLNSGGLEHLGLGEVGGPIFRYRWGVAPEDHNSGFWVLQFHESITYYVKTGAITED